MRFDKKTASPIDELTSRPRASNRDFPVLFAIAVFAALFTAGAVGPSPAQAQAPQETEIADASNGGDAILSDPVPMGEGTIRSWIRLDENDNPQALGVTFTEEALTGLPASLTPGIIWKEFLVDLPAEAKEKTPFDHFGVNWNPEGHIPEKIYGVPHFDVHLYMITPEKRDQITFRGEGMDKIQKKPPAAYLPEGYIYAKNGEEPGMGAHWVDSGAPELQGEPFTHTFIYGSYNGEVIFQEPMVTKEFLERRPDTTVQIKQPEKYPGRGYYPTTYSIRYNEDGGEYAVALGGMKHRSSEE